jgi:hypothetical protein
MHCSLKGVSFSSYLKQKQHAMFMLAGHMLLIHDNLTLIELFFAWLGGDVGLGKSHVI